MAELPPMGKERGLAVKNFQTVVDAGYFDAINERVLARSSRKKALAKWKKIREENPMLGDDEIEQMKKAQAAERRKKSRQAKRNEGLSSKGQILRAHRWRMLVMNDRQEATWNNKLSFIPIAQVQSYGKQNLARLQKLHERIVVALRLRGGNGSTTTTVRHQKGNSFGVTVAPGGRQPPRPQERSDHYSGTIQLKQQQNAETAHLQQELIAVVEACIEEAFGVCHWYRAVKHAFKEVPVNRRLPNCKLPVSNIWWNWNVNNSTSHIDKNTTAPCFVFTPYTYKGAELLCAAGNRKIPLKEGQIVGGSWQLWPHCNDKLHSDERYSIVAYFDYRMLQDNYWIR